MNALDFFLGMRRMLESASNLFSFRFISSARFSSFFYLLPSIDSFTSDGFSHMKKATTNCFLLRDRLVETTVVVSFLFFSFLSISLCMFDCVYKWGGND
jgi:hypothetical protein